MIAGEWIKHDGKGMPVDGDVMVLCRFGDDGDEELRDLPMPAKYWHGLGLDDSNWIGDDENRITEYKVVA